MKTAKIVLAIILLYGAGSEYVNASRELKTFFAPEILAGVLVFLLLCAWLIGSAFSKGKLKPLNYLKFFVITLVGFGVISFLSLSAAIMPKNIVEVNGLKVPLDACIEGSKRIIPNKEERKEYCLCLADKITSDSTRREKYKEQLESGRMDKVLKDLKASENFLELGIDACIKTTDLEWTDNLVKSVKENWLDQLEGTEFEETNNLEEYCDCMINEYKKYSTDKILEDGFSESELGLSIDSMCTEKSIRIQ